MFIGLLMLNDVWIKGEHTCEEEIVEVDYDLNFLR